MKALFVFVAALLAAAAADYVGAAEALLARRFPGLVGSVVFEEIAQEDGKDVFEIEGAAAPITIRGNNGVSMAAGLGHYLRHYLHVQLSWTGDQTANAVEEKVVGVGEKVRVVSPLKYSYYMNVCTLSYSSAWWDWERWLREIDWMALNGVNLPLAHTGQEFIFRALFREFGLSDEEIKEFFGGPAFMAWFRMGNLALWGGPLPDAWIDSQYQLQLQILEQMREFGMKPVLTMFTGHVPAGLKNHYNVTMEKGTQWAGFGEEYAVYNLDAADPLYNQLGKRFIELQTMYFGTDHIYNGDLFNEMQPASNDPAYLKQAAKGTYDGIAAADPEAIWLMQGWLFHYEANFWQPAQVEAYLSGVPNDKMIILDLFTECNPVWSKHQNYYGKQWIWCTLHNFGGNPGMWGDLNHILTQPQNDRVSENSTMIGIGITMEAIDNNYIVYEATLHNKWISEPVSDIAGWVGDYAHARYGDAVVKHPEIADAWEILRTVIYSYSYHNESQIEHYPTFDGCAVQSPQRNVAGVMESSPEFVLKGTLNDLWSAMDIFLSEPVIAELRDIDTFKHDVVDLGVNILTNVFNMARRALYQAHVARDVEKAKLYGQHMLDLILDADTLLATDKIYLLGRWIEMARTAGKSVNEEALFIFNARNQLTFWGPTGNINDYARKSWAGLFKDYYYGRWEIFIQEVIRCTSEGVDYNQANIHNSKMYPFEEAWQTADKVYESRPVGDTVTVMQQMAAKYRNLL